MIEVWDLKGTRNQNAIVEEAIERTTFPWEVMLPKLQVEKNKTRIPVEWADLSRYAAVTAKSREVKGHSHIHEDGDTADPIEREVDGRSRVLGLAWYSGKVTLDLSMESNPELAQEVFLSEGAHMIDFFWMTEEHRVAIWNALHDSDVIGVPESGPVEHEHSWFDHGGYYSWVGEAWMGLFVKTYSDVPVTIDFDHPPTEEAQYETRRALTPFYWSGRGKVFHDAHRGIHAAIYLPRDFDQYDELPALRACKTCDPLKSVGELSPYA